MTRPRLTARSGGDASRLAILPGRSGRGAHDPAAPGNPRRAIETIEKADDFCCRRIVESVIDRSRVAARPNQSVAAEPRQMLREMRLTHAEQRLELADGLLAFGQMTENEQSMRVC